MIVSPLVLKWADGDYAFALRLREIEELQRLSEAGIGTIARRLLTAEPRLSDIVHTIRLGLIGGGTPPVRASQLIELYVEGQPLARPGDPSSPIATAMAVIASIWTGLDAVDTARPDEPAKEGDDGIDVAAIRGRALGVGITPEEVGRLTLHEMMTTAVEYGKASNGRGGEGPVTTEATYDEVIADLRGMGVPNVRV